MNMTKTMALSGLAAVSAASGLGIRALLDEGYATGLQNRIRDTNKLG